MSQKIYVVLILLQLNASSPLCHSSQFPNSLSLFLNFILDLVLLIFITHLRNYLQFLCLVSLIACIASQHATFVPVNSYHPVTKVEQLEASTHMAAFGSTVQFAQLYM